MTVVNQTYLAIVIIKHLSRPNTWGGRQQCQSPSNLPTGVTNQHCFTGSASITTRSSLSKSLLSCSLKTVGLPWWRSGWESACQCRGHGFEPWSGRIPHAAEQLGPWTTITEPARLEPVLRNKRGRDNERPAHRDEEWPPLAAIRESPSTETKTQHSHK